MSFKDKDYWLRLVSREDHALVLDFMPRGNPVDTHHPSHRDRPIAQAVGCRYFTLVEFHPKSGVSITIEERVYIGFTRRELRDKVAYVWGEPIAYEDLTAIAKSNLPLAIQKIILDLEKEFTKFFNTAPSLTIKLHVLELIPGIGKKTLWVILEERAREEFKDFADIKNRIKGFDPVKALTERILNELRGVERYYLFAHPPKGVATAAYLDYLSRLYIEK
ncbi:MAG: DUF655 domain-containing protein [Sulfolobales archaeon]|nr:DUF655 domain-containing protein [Sulfolobales archaeon]MDW8083142.1 DUF655 domain-containing protein [Sulfolobales archaeon]